MERFILKKLLAWKDSPYRKPLILKGVRQVGKTWILKEFGRRCYENTAYFNFDENEEYTQFFETTKDVARILQNLMPVSYTHLDVYKRQGKMLYGWVAADNAERVDDTDGDAFKEGDYYFGGEDDGAMTTGWLLMDITYDEATSDYEIAPAFNEDEDQSRWFYFKSNGKKVYSTSTDETKNKTINGKKYTFDQYGAMVAEWSLDIKKASTNVGTSNFADYEKKANSAKYSQSWRYFSSVEDGARVSKGWFKVCLLYTSRSRRQHWKGHSF